MDKTTSRLKNELRRLAEGPGPDEVPDGIGTVPYTVYCPGGVDDVLARTKAVLRLVDEATLQGWPAKAEAAPLLPEWFVAACRPDMTDAQIEQWLKRWRAMDPAEQAKAEMERGWSLADWLYWLEPENREWYWWEAVRVTGQEQASVSIEVEAWPFPWGALKWLFHAAGATLVADED